MDRPSGDNQEYLIRHLAALGDGDLLLRTVVSAAMNADGSLDRVSGAGIEAKLAALFRRQPLDIENGKLPPRAVGFSERQSELLNVPGIGDHCQVKAIPRLLFKGKLADLAVALVVEQTSREGFKPHSIRDLQSKYPSNTFVGRSWLFKRIEQSIAGRNRGLILLLAGPGFGKTAFMLKLIDTYVGHPLGNAYLHGWHMLRWDQPNLLSMSALTCQIETQLRDRLGLPFPDTSALNDTKAPTALKNVLDEAMQRLPKGSKLLIAIDGLDEAFGSNAPIIVHEQARLLHELLPQELPEGVFILITSRPDKNILKTGRRRDVDVINIDSETEFHKSNDDDLRLFLKQKIDAIGDSFRDGEDRMSALVDRMVSASDGSFFVADWFARDATAPEIGPDGNTTTRYQGWLAGETLPHGIDEALASAWNRKLHLLGKNEPVLPILAVALALWQESGIKPTLGVISDLVLSAPAAIQSGDTSLPYKVGNISPSKFSIESITACLDQLTDWFFTKEPGSKSVFEFRHRRISQLLLDPNSSLESVDHTLLLDVHKLLAWSSARWCKLNSGSRIAALRMLPRHLQALGQNDNAAAQNLADLLLDYCYLVAALGADPREQYRPMAVSELVDCIREAIQLAARVDARHSRAENNQMDEALIFMASALELSTDALLKYPRELPAQLYGRLMDCTHPRISRLRSDIDRLTSWPWLRIEWGRALMPAGGALKRVLKAPPSYDDIQVSISPDCKQAVLVSLDGTLRVLDIDSGNVLYTLQGHSDYVGAVAITSDSKHAVYGSNDGTLFVWDLKSGKIVHTLKEHNDAFNHVAITRDGKHAVSASDDCTLVVWDVIHGEVVFSLKEHNKAVNHVAITRDGKHAVSASDDCTLVVWNIDNGQAVRSLCGHSDRVNHVAITRDGKRAVSASDDNTLRVWSLDKNDSLRVFRAHSREVRQVAITPDEKQVVSASIDGTLIVWDLENGQILHRFDHLFEFEDHVFFKITHDGKRVLAAGGYWNISILDIKNGTVLGSLEGHVYIPNCIALTADSSEGAVTADNNGNLCFWDLSQLAAPVYEIEHNGPISVIEIAPHGDKVITAGGADGELRVCDIETGKLLYSLYGHESWVNEGLITHNDQQAVSADIENNICVWDFAKSRIISDTASYPKLPISGHSEELLKLLPDGRRAISTCKDKGHSLLVWDIASRDIVFELQGHASKILDLKVYQDGARAVSSSEDKTLRIWDIQNNKLLHTLKGHLDAVDYVDVSRNGMWAVSCSPDQTLRVWNLETGAPLHILRNEREIPLVAKISPSGLLAIAFYKGGVVKACVWDLESGTCLYKLYKDEFSIDGPESGGVFFLNDRTAAFPGMTSIEVVDLLDGLTVSSLTSELGPIRLKPIYPCLNLEMLCGCFSGSFSKIALRNAPLL